MATSSTTLEKGSSGGSGIQGKGNTSIRIRELNTRGCMVLEVEGLCDSNNGEMLP